MESSQFFSKQMRKKSIIKDKIARIKHAAWNVSKLHSSSSTSIAVKVSLERHEVEKFSRERQ